MAAAAAGRGRFRTSHADREYVLEVLKAAFVHGRLTKDEFDMRVGQTFDSRTYAELAALTADIPAGLIGAQPLRKPGPGAGLTPAEQGSQFMRLCGACRNRAGGRFVHRQFRIVLGGCGRHFWDFACSSEPDRPFVT